MKSSPGTRRFQRAVLDGKSSEASAARMKPDDRDCKR